MATTCSVCSKALAPNEVLYTADARMVCASCNATADLVATKNRSSTSLGITGVGLVAAALPMLFRMSRVTIIGDEVTYRDWVAIGGGVAAILCGAIALVVALKRKLPKERVGLAALVIGAGVFQIARGTGVFEDRESLGAGMPHMTMMQPPSLPAPPPSTDPASCPDEQACDSIASRLEDKDPAGAQVANERSCTFGNPHACTAAARQHSADKKPDQAVPLWLKACDGGDMSGCTNAGAGYINGDGVAKDLDRGRSLMIKACEAGAKYACRNLAVMYDQGVGVEKDADKFMAYLLRTCEGDGNYESSDAPAIAEMCEIAGNRFKAGVGVKADPERALKLYDQACKIAPEGCFELAIAAAAGLGSLKKDPKLARELYTRGCDAGHPASCNNLGDLINRGLGGPKDAEAAKALFKKACDGGSKVGCNNLE